MMGVFNFDPDRFVSREPAEVVPLRTMPDAWAHGLTLLDDRGVPKGCNAQRWDQIIADSRRIATLWADQCVAAGWSIENLFGFDPKQAEGELSLSVVLRSGRLLDIGPDAATVVREHSTLIHRPRMPAGSPLLWTFRERDLW